MTAHTGPVHEAYADASILQLSALPPKKVGKGRFLLRLNVLCNDQKAWVQLNRKVRTLVEMLKEQGLDATVEARTCVDMGEYAHPFLPVSVSLPSHAH